MNAMEFEQFKQNFNQNLTQIIAQKSSISYDQFLQKCAEFSTNDDPQIVALISLFFVPENDANNSLF
jgi:hypothetical protein